MTTKDDMIEKYAIGCTNGQAEFEFENLYKAMDEWAKVTAIAFADFLHLNYQPLPEAGMWYDHHKDQSGKHPIISDEIYAQFIESQNTK